MENKSRRQFLKIAGAVSAASVLPNIGKASSSTAMHGEKNYRSWPVKLGVASYSLRMLSRAQAIALTNELRTPFICIKSHHLPYYLSQEELDKGRAEFEKAGLKIVGGGNNNIRKDTDEHIQMFFEYAKNAGIPLLVIAPTTTNLKRIEKFVKKYDIKVAIHNHGPEDKYFPAPSDALKLIKDLDPRFGLCVDIGHTVRTGADVVQEIADAGDRVLDLHIKDLRDLMDKGSQCVVGEGKMPMVEIFKQLKKMKFAGYANLEFEIDKNNPANGMKQSFAYMRGLLNGLEA